MIKISLVGCIVICLFSSVFGLKLSGNLQYHSEQTIQLLGYEGFKTIVLSVDTISKDGDFVLHYENYKGMAYLETQDKSVVFVVLNEPNIQIYGKHLNNPDSLLFRNSRENEIFNQYALEHNHREYVKAGWRYLLPEYQAISIFKKQQGFSNFIEKEINRLEKEDASFLKEIPTSAYVSWFLPIRKLIEDMPMSVQRYREQIPVNMENFRHLNLNDKRLYSSGVLDDLLEGHFLLIENMGQSLDSVYAQMEISIDYITENLAENNKLLNDVGSYLFNFFEKRSLFSASEYLAVKLLTQNSCSLNDNFVKQLESYRVMKVGNIAPSIDFSKSKLMLFGSAERITSLSRLANKYTLVVFGASWCPHCVTEVEKLQNYYPIWQKNYNLEIVFISLDRSESDFTSFATSFPWISYCDYKEWSSEVVQAYYVFGTPTLFLLDKNKKIVLRPRSVEHVNSWIR